MQELVIRSELPVDIDAIHNLTDFAFRDMPYSGGTEAKIVDKLRDADRLTISLVALRGEEVVGHVACSPVLIGGVDYKWYGLGPISVQPDLQRQGVGSRLIEQGVADLQKLGAKGCVLLGDPDYYERFGFVVDSRVTYPHAPAEYFQSLILDGDMPEGEVTYHSAFDE